MLRGEFHVQMTPGDFCLADPGQTYVIYLPKGGGVAVKLETGNYPGVVVQSTLRGEDRVAGRQRTELDVAGCS